MERVIERRGSTYSIRWRDSLGRRRRASGFRTRREALRALREAAEGLSATPRLSLQEFTALWRAEHPGSPSTVARLRSQSAAFSELDWSLTPAQVRSWRARQPEGSRHQRHAVLRQVLDAAVADGLLDANPARAVRNPTPRRPERDYFSSWEELLPVAEACGAYRDLILFAAATGMRPGEWCELRWRDLADGAFLVTRAWTESGVGLPKTGARRVPLTPFAAGLLPERGRELVWTTSRGARVRPKNLARRVWTPASGMVLYSLRHTYAALALEAGVPAYTVARRMGTSLRMIDATYGHLVREVDPVLDPAPGPALNPAG